MNPHACACGGTSRVLRMADKRRVVVMDDELDQITRWRACNACDSYWPTVELRRSDLAELRRLAYLGHLAAARQAQAPTAAQLAPHAGTTTQGVSTS